MQNSLTPKLTIVALLIAAACAAFPDTDHFSHVTFTPPPGWTRAEAGGWLQFTPMAAKPMWIIGRAVFENGQPIPKFHVQAGGFSGKFDPFLNNQLRGPQQLRET